MHRTLRHLAITIAVSAPVTASAQSIPKMFWHDFKYGVRDVFAVWASPFTGSGRDYLTTGLVLTGVGLSAL